MSEAVSVATRAKDPRLVAAGKKAMRARWGPIRVVRLDQLDPNVAAAIRALVAADEAARKAADDAG
jgi:hypothetical protein